MGQAFLKMMQKTLNKADYSEVEDLVGRYLTYKCVATKGCQGNDYECNVDSLKIWRCSKCDDYWQNQAFEVDGKCGSYFVRKVHYPGKALGHHRWEMTIDHQWTITGEEFRQLVDSKN